MVHGFKPGKHVKKLYSYHKVCTNPWFQTMILHEVIVSNHISYFKTITWVTLCITQDGIYPFGIMCPENKSRADDSFENYLHDRV
jgi:hypothetical protein